MRGGTSGEWRGRGRGAGVVWRDFAVSPNLTGFAVGDIAGINEED